MSSAEHQHDIRFAAETIYRSAQRPPPAPHTRYDMPRMHFAHLDLLSFINEDYIAGYTQDGQMSTVRRFFCLFVAFDLFIVSMLWFIFIMINGETIVHALKDQVLNYTIESSLFDLILAALVRFVLLIIFYGVFAMNHWSIIAFTTTSSCAFLVGKVFYFNWQPFPQPIIQVLMIIVSCVLAWGEAWFLDCRVIPKEKSAQRFYRFLMAQNENDERSPLLDSYFNTIRQAGPVEGSEANFYSPMESIHNSDSEEDENDSYKNKAMVDIQASCELLECIDWKMEKIVSATGDRIQSIQRKSIGKIYRLSGQINLPAKVLFHKLYYGVENMPSWNPTVLEARVLKQINIHTDITYSVSAPAGGGLVESRDFVNLRTWQVIKNGNIIENIDIVMDEKMPTEKSLVKIERENEQQMKRSASYSNVVESDKTKIQRSAMDQSVLSLSKSLGAKVFTSDEPPEVFSSHSTDDPDEFVDANESQGAQSTIESLHPSEETEHIKGMASDLCDKMYMISGSSIKYEEMPRVPKYTRGENLMGCWAMRESKSFPNTCTFEWIMCLDLKGRFPRFVLDKAYTTVMQEFMVHLRKHCESAETSSS